MIPCKESVTPESVTVTLFARDDHVFGVSVTSARRVAFPFTSASRSRGSRDALV
jgi:hypothetical protein